MTGPGNNIKRYSEFNMNNDSQKIGIFVVGYANYISPTYIRLLSVFNKISPKYDCCIIDVNKNDQIELVKSDLINESFFLDIVIIEREAFHSNEFIELLIEKCKLFGVKIIYEIDDDLINIDKTHIDFPYFNQKRSGIFYILKNADAIVVSTNALKSKIRNYSENIVVIPNVLTQYWDVVAEKPKRTDESIIKIGYVGTPTHKDDVNLLKDAIKSVKKYFSSSDKTIIFEMIAGTTEKLDWANQFEVPMDKRVYPKFVEYIKGFIDWDIALAPLKDTKLNSTKSELKYLEYTGLNIPGIYSNIGPYKENIIHEFNGLLVKENTPDEWANTIIRLLEDPELRNTILKNAKEDVEVNHNLNIAINLWEDVLKRVSRDKNTLLYEKFYEFQNTNSESFLEFLKENSYEIILNSGLFDDKFYLSYYEDVTNNELDPISHYLNFGVSENCNPSKSFKTSDYLEKFPNIKLNPFVHHILYNEILDNPLIKFTDNIHSKDVSKNYGILKNSRHFDSSFYLSRNEDVVKAKMDPLMHWVKYGFREVKRNPNNYFSKEYYSKKYLINGEEYWNQLTHYEIIGESKSFKQNIFDIVFKNVSNELIEKMFHKFYEKTCIIIPILSISKYIYHLLNSLVNYTHPDFELIFIVESSIKTKFDLILNQFELSVKFIEISDSAMVFESVIGTINNLKTDVVLLNSYCVVTENWLNKLKIKAYSNEDFGAVSPVSNLISGLSTDSLKNYESSVLLSINEINTLMEKSADLNNIILNYFDGSCVYIKYDSIHDLDLNQFNFIYDNEKNIFGMNLIFKNKLYLLDDTTYVYVTPDFFHENEAFLNEQKSENFLLNLKMNQFLNSFEYKQFKDNYLIAMQSINNCVLNERILYILNENNLNSLESFLILSKQNSYDNYYLTFSHDFLKLWKNNIILKRWNVDYSNLNSLEDKDLFKIYFNILISLDINKVHIYDFTNSFFNLLNIIKLFNISLDIYCSTYYFICKYSNSEDYCNQECDMSFNCPHICLKKDNEKWQKLVFDMFNIAEKLFINKTMKNIYKNIFIDFDDKMIFIDNLLTENMSDIY